MSTEDLSLCRTEKGSTCFRQLQAIPSKLYLSAVNEPLQVLRDIVSVTSNDDIVVTSAADAVEKISATRGQFAFVRFAANVDAIEQPAERFQRHDGIIAEIVAEVGRVRGNLLVIYTGAGSSSPSVTTQINAHRRVVRQAAAANNATTLAPPTTSKPAVHHRQEDGVVIPDYEVFFSRPRLMVYFLNMSLGEEEQIDIVDLTVTEETAAVVEGSTGDETAERLLVVLSTVGPTPVHTLSFNITGSGGYWQADEFDFDGVRLLLQHHTIATLTGFSFHCTPDIRFVVASTGAAHELRWTGLQMQAFFGDLDADNNSTVFGEAWDCVGFTSAGIWGGLFVTILMLVILSIGISWMMEIRTMDRFDDAKGKTITVNTNE